MFTEGIKAFKERHGIPSADKWEEVSGVSKSTISRALNGTCKDMGVETLRRLVAPYGGSIDEILGIGHYSPEEIEKTEIVEKLDTVIEDVENNAAIPQKPTEEIVTALAEAKEYIASGQTEHCVTCGVYSKILDDLKKAYRNRGWIIALFVVMFIALLILELLHPQYGWIRYEISQPQSGWIK